MTFVNLASGEQVFLDANTLVYHFSPHPVLGQVCSQLIGRIESSDLLGFTSTHIVTELAHRLMMFELSKLQGWSTKKIKLRLRSNPHASRQLTEFRKAIESVLNSRLRILTIDPSLVLAAADISRQTGLLSSDALLVAVMRQHGLSRLASHDADFDNVPGLARYAPA